MNESIGLFRDRIYRTLMGLRTGKRVGVRAGMESEEQMILQYGNLWIYVRVEHRKPPVNAKNTPCEYQERAKGWFDPIKKHPKDGEKVEIRCNKGVFIANFCAMRGRGWYRSKDNNHYFNFRFHNLEKRFFTEDRDYHYSKPKYIFMDAWRYIEPESGR